MSTRTPAGRLVSVSPAKTITNVRSQPVLCDTKYNGEFDDEYLKLNGRSMEDLLATFASMPEEHLIALRSYVHFANGVVHVGRLMVAMDAAYYRQTPALRPEGLMIIAGEADAFHLEPDQSQIALRYVQLPIHPRIRTQNQAASVNLGSPFPDAQLTSFGTIEQTAFKRAVYNEHIASSQRRGRQFHADIPSAELVIVEGGHRMQRDAANACIQLLMRARSDLDSEKQRLLGLALEAHAIGVGSAYRSATTEFTIWNGLFEKYYNDTSEVRSELSGGEHGPAAVGLMVKHYTTRKAAPGFGNHTNGIAVDFVTTQGSRRLGASVSQNGLWRKSWFHVWLTNYASEFSFAPLSSEAWHWEYHA